METIAKVERITGAREFTTTNRMGQTETIPVVGVMLETINGAQLYVEVFGEKTKHIADGTGLQPADTINADLSFRTSEYTSERGTRYNVDVRLLNWQVLNRNCF